MRPELLRDPAANPSSFGVGIRGISERVRELGGRIRIKNAMPGTIVKVVLPLHRREPLPAIEPPKSENVRVQGA